MYHIKNDQRAQRSAKTIYTTLASLMQEMPFERIRVRDIVLRGEIGRSTFYRNFDEIEDVLRMRCDHVFDELIAYIMAHRQAAPYSGVGGLLRPMLRYFYLHSDIIDLLLRANRIDILQESFRVRSRPIQVQFAQQMQASDEYIAYLAEVRLSVMIAIVTHWVKTGKRQAPDELADNLKAMLHNMRTVDQLL